MPLEVNLFSPMVKMNMEEAQMAVQLPGMLQKARQESSLTSIMVKVLKQMQKHMGMELIHFFTYHSLSPISPDGGFINFW